MTVSLFATIIAFMTSPVVAKNCYPGLNYCGHTLRDIAWFNSYDDQIKEQLVLNGKAPTEENIERSLFHCTGGPDGEIKFVKVCDDPFLDTCRTREKENDVCSTYIREWCLYSTSQGDWTTGPC
ncbi:hypothetical protein CP532_3137 [Ophiocordyceps camponoti-leonardi (nom. inval.)]|nr:hypothetical protein CP532_3137 [Ophiocordyceps camponoti-leonardi (nom. inval.)]